MFRDLIFIEGCIADGIRRGVPARKYHSLDQSSGSRGRHTEGAGCFIIQCAQDRGAASQQHHHADQCQNFHDQQDDIDAAEGTAAGNPFDCFRFCIIEQVFIDRCVIGIHDPPRGAVGSDPCFAAADFALHQHFVQFVVSK